MGLTWHVHEATDAAHDLARDLNNSRQSDRSVAILAAAYLELHLRMAIEQRLLHVTDLRLPKNKNRDDKDIFYRLFDGVYGALTSLSAKVDIACALGIVSANTYHDLAIIRKLRNDFAHKPAKLIFRNPDVAAMCKTFLSPRTVRVVWGNNGEKRLARTPREMYLSAVNLMSKLVFTETVRVQHVPPQPLCLPWD
ncbi:MAG TPA: hypothetical protein VMS17_26315 [Gemmataceae bacterium]|nr:hypothetical protein [Gemmataceae bacterium]